MSEVVAQTLVAICRDLYKRYGEGRQIVGDVGRPGVDVMGPIYALHVVTRKGGWAILQYCHPKRGVGFKLCSLTNARVRIGLTDINSMPSSQWEAQAPWLRSSFVQELREAVAFPRLGAAYGFVQKELITVHIQAGRTRVGSNLKPVGLPRFVCLSLNERLFPKALWELTPQVFWQFRQSGQLQPLDQVIARLPYPLLYVNSTHSDAYMVLAAPHEFRLDGGRPSFLPLIPYCPWDQKFLQLRIAGSPNVFNPSNFSSEQLAAMDLRAVTRRRLAEQIPDYYLRQTKLEQLT